MKGRLSAALKARTFKGPKEIAVDPTAPQTIKKTLTLYDEPVKRLYSGGSVRDDSETYIGVVKRYATLLFYLSKFGYLLLSWLLSIISC